MGELQWWCAARGEAWSWGWRVYPGVWIFVAIFAATYWRLARSGSAGEPNAPAKRWLAAAGLILLWASLDWPIGRLGAGFLAGVHSLQYVLLGMVIPVLLISGATGAAFARLRRSPRSLAAVRVITNPPVAALVFTGVMVATHLAPVVDALMPSELGNFAIDVAWLLSGLVLAWPVLSPVPERPRFNAGLQILYIFCGTVAHVFIAMWLLSSPHPVYATYELAPRVSGIAALTDQHLAGAVMLLIGSPLILLAMTIIFFRWQGTGAEREPANE